MPFAEHIPQQIHDLCANNQAHLDRETFAPPPRFQQTSFDNYQINAQVSGQAEAVATIRTFASREKRKFWQFGRRNERQGLYMDGDFGVGKTHLLSSCYHAANGQRKYLSFSEAISLCVLVGPDRAVELLAGDLVCIDEFELDDPSNTRLADLLLEGLIARNTRIITTSNTVPDELGAGRFAAELFTNQLVRISANFDSVHVPGEDFRRKSRRKADEWLPAWAPDVEAPEANERALIIEAKALDRLLKNVPIINLREFAASVSHVHVHGMQSWPDQLSALRFVHLIDKLYDFAVPLSVQADVHIDEIFLPDYRDWAFKKKYRRCQSRLTEMCAK